MSRFWSAITSGLRAAVAPIEFREVLLFTGCALIGAGLWTVYPPAALAVPGAILAGVAFFGTP
jgi:hypothetical protein